ncbi:hypothetical protein GCM10022245_01110 [Streptomyces mayteni]
MSGAESNSHSPGPVPRPPREEVRRRPLVAAGRVFAARAGITPPADAVTAEPALGAALGRLTEEAQK